MSNTPGTPPPESREPFLGRRSTIVVSAAFLLLIAIAAVVLVVMPGRGGATAQGQAGGPSSSPSASSPAAASGCHPTDTSQAVPTSAPAGVTWQLFQGVAVPYSTAAGPLGTSGDAATCYADTPTGALIAAAQISARAAAAPDWRSVALASLEPGMGRDKYMAAEQQAEQQPGASSAAGPGSYGQFAGFKFVTYTPNLTVIQLVVQFSASSTLQLSTVTLARDQGDWKLQPQADGSLTPSAQAVSSLAGFVPWGGVA